MPELDKSIPQQWVTHGNMDVQAAEILLAQNEPLQLVAFHIQQATEKYLKGYLLSVGWKLRKIHDVELLIQEVIERDQQFARFLPLCQKITEYYIETRYPTGLKTDLNSDDLQTELTLLQELKLLIPFS